MQIRNGIRILAIDLPYMLLMRLASSLTLRLAIESCLLVVYIQAVWILDSLDHRSASIEEDLKTRESNYSF